MKVLKKYILTLFLIYQAEKLNAQDKIFFSDTIIEVAELKIKFENGYSRDEIAKVKVVVSNLSDKYIIIKPADIFMTTLNGEEVTTSYKKNIVIPPKDLLKVTLLFKGINGVKKSSVSIGFKNIGFSDALINSFEALNVIADLGLRVEKDNLNIEVIEVNPRAKDYAVKLDIKYSGVNLLTINYTKALFSTEYGDFTNNRKSKTSYNTASPSQRMLMIFPYTRGRDIKIQGNVKLGEVFKEYSVKNMHGIKIKLRQMSKVELQNKKEEKEEVIEEID